MQAKDKVMLAKEDQHLQVCRLKVRKLIGSLRVSALKLGALKVAYQAGKGKAARQISRVDVRLRKSEPLMKHMATAEAKFQKEHALLKTNEEKLRKTMQINQGLTTALADKQRKSKLSAAQAKST